MEGDVGHVPYVLLVLGNILGRGDDRVGDVAVSAPADERHPVLVQPTGVHLAADLDAVVQDHLCEVSKADAPVVELQFFCSATVPTV